MRCKIKIWLSLLIFIFCVISTIGIYPEFYIVLAEEPFFFIEPFEDVEELTRQQEALIAELKLLEGYAEVLKLKFGAIDAETYRLYFNDYIDDVRQLKIYIENIEALNESLAIVQEKLKFTNLALDDASVSFGIWYVSVTLLIVIFLIGKAYR
jgi:hypothetical protein